MKITVEQYEDKFTIETKDDGLIVSEFMDHLYSIGVATGYHPDSVANAMYQKGVSMSEYLNRENELYDE